MFRAFVPFKKNKGVTMIKEPTARVVCEDEPSITTQRDGEPEKDFGKVSPPERDDEPKPRPTPDEDDTTPPMTTMSTGEPEKDFGRRFLG